MVKFLLVGQLLYNQYCLSCHGYRGQGAIGPNIQGSSYELLYMKTTMGRYPPNYKPKRDTKTMPRIALDKEEVDAIQEYLK